MLNEKIYNCLNKKKSISCLINRVFIENLNQIAFEYNLLVSEILDFKKNLLEINSDKFVYIIQNNIPHLIIKLQCLFIESPWVSLLSFLEIKKNKLLSEMIPKNCQLFVDDIKKLELDVKLYNLSLINILLKKTLIKTIQKNYKAQPVKKIWTNQKNNLKNKLLKIHTFRDLILQKII